MQSTYPRIARYTPAVLDMACRERNLTPEQFRLNTLKRVECDLGNFLESHAEPLHPDEEVYLTDLHRQVRLALADE